MSENTTPIIYRNGHFYGGADANIALMDKKLNKTSDNIAPKQDSDTANKLITVGEYFINKDGYLCQCDIQIANQGTITVGTNCHVITDGLANELNGKILRRWKFLNYSVNAGSEWATSWTITCSDIPNHATLFKMQFYLENWNTVRSIYFDNFDLNYGASGSGTLLYQKSDGTRQSFGVISIGAFSSSNNTFTISSSYNIAIASLYVLE